MTVQRHNMHSVDDTAVSHTNSFCGCHSTFNVSPWRGGCSDFTLPLLSAQTYTWSHTPRIGFAGGEWRTPWHWVPARMGGAQARPTLLAALIWPNFRSPQIFGKKIILANLRNFPINTHPSAILSGFWENRTPFEFWPLFNPRSLRFLLFLGLTSGARKSLEKR